MSNMKFDQEGIIGEDLSSLPPHSADEMKYGPAEVTPISAVKRSVLADYGWNNNEHMSFPTLPDSDSKKQPRDTGSSRRTSVCSASSSEDSVDAAILLTAMRSIASREICTSQAVTPILGPARTLTPTSANIEHLTLPDISTKSCADSGFNFTAPDMETHLRSPDTPRSGMFPWTEDIQRAALSPTRMRAVSFDCSNGFGLMEKGGAQHQLILDLTTSSPSEESMHSARTGTPEIRHPPVVHTYVTPTGKRKKIEGPATIVVAPRKLKGRASVKPPGAMKTILRRKFSWKNYPELEAFLVANRDEYLRHSTLNYTVQQKQFNNRLTEQLIELAEQNGYVFDSSAFNFVTIRDRIRCYFKSYVQSSKKRGLIIGYAAKRAGLVTDRDLEHSACTAGKIIVPT